MARKARRTHAARIALTAAVYQAVESAAFKNCRTVSQELSYMIERQIAGKAPAPALAYNAPLAHYDSPAASQDAPQANEPSPVDLPPPGWTPEQEAKIYALGQDAGLGEAQITALRIIHKHYGAVVTAIEAERVPA